MQYDIETAAKIAENWLTGETARAIIPPYCFLCDGEEKQPEQSHVMQTDGYNQPDGNGGGWGVGGHGGRHRMCSILPKAHLTLHLTK